METSVLLVIDIESGTRTVLEVPPYRFLDIPFSWSPEGRMIAYCLSEKAEMQPDWQSVDSEVFVINADGTGKTQLTDTAEVEGYLKWMPDGRRILVERIDPLYENDWKLVYLILETVK